MASSTANLRTKRVLSISLPSRSHPLVPQFDECLCRVHSSESTSVSSSSISQRLDGLKELYDCVDSIFVQPSTQNAPFQDPQNSEMVNDLLDGLLRLLDICTATKETLSTKKTHLQELQSAFRRRRGDDVLSADIKKYLSDRVKVKREMQKTLRNLKLTEAQGFSLMSENGESAVEIGILKEVESTTLAVMESLMSFPLGQRSSSRPRSWSLVSKLMRAKSVTYEGTTKLNEVEQLHTELEILLNQNTISSNMYNSSHKGLQELEMSIQHLDKGIECLYRELIRARAALLNIFSC